MDAEHVQDEQGPSRRNVRRRQIQLPVALIIIGIVLIDIAVLGLQESFSLTITAPPYGNLTVHCGTLSNATSSVPTVRLSDDSRAKLNATTSGAAYVVALEKMKNSCRIAGQLRFDVSITAAVLGLAAIFAAFRTSGRIKATAERPGPAPPSDGRSVLRTGRLAAASPSGGLSWSAMANAHLNYRLSVLALKYAAVTMRAASVRPTRHDLEANART
jgi:hypothetical protein